MPLYTGIHVSRCESNSLFRLFVSGDLRNLITLAARVRPILPWVPTREREIVLECREEIERLAPNLRERTDRSFTACFRGTESRFLSMVPVRVVARGGRVEGH